MTGSLLLLSISQFLISATALNPFDCAARESFHQSTKLAMLEGGDLFDSERRCAMRDEFASRSFLAVTVAGLFLLCSGLVAITFT
jgi:hypothetical protein